MVKQIWVGQDNKNNNFEFKGRYIELLNKNLSPCFYPFVFYYKKQVFVVFVVNIQQSFICSFLKFLPQIEESIHLSTTINKR